MTYNRKTASQCCCDCLTCHMECLPNVALMNQCHLELVLEKLRHGLIKNGYLFKICLASWSVLLSVDFFPSAISLSLLLQRVKNRTMKPVAQSPDHFFHSSWKVSSAIYKKKNLRPDNQENHLAEMKYYTLSLSSVSLCLSQKETLVMVDRHSVRAIICLRSERVDGIHK